MLNSYLLILILALVIFSVLILIILVFIRKKIVKQPEVKIPTVGWSSTTTGTCNSYVFPSVFNGGFTRPEPTFNPQVVNTLKPTTFPNTGSTCYDFDTIYAFSTTQTCNDGESNNLVCIKDDGSFAKHGSTQNTYTSCNVQPCAGNLSMISLGYYEGRELCLTQALNVATCNPSNPSQQFRITRTTDNNTTPSPSTQSGLLTQIYDRVTGQCLDVDFTTNETITVDFSDIPVCNSSTTSSITGPKVVWGSCGNKNGYSNGFFWYSVDSYSGSNLPQQLVYVADSTDTLATSPGTDLMAQLQSRYSVFAGKDTDFPIVQQRDKFSTSDCTQFFSTYQPFNLSSFNFNNEYNKMNSCFYTSTSGWSVTSECLTTENT